MTTVDPRDSAVEVILRRGAMQNWSDLAQPSSADSEIVRRLVAEVAIDVRSCLLVGAHSLDFVLALSQSVDSLTIVTRSTVDAAELVARLPIRVVVLVGSVGAVGDDQFDLVVALDDFERVASLEAPTTWAEILNECVGRVAVGGALVVGCRGELGLDSLVARPSRRTTNTNADWAVETTFDDSRPVTEMQLGDAVTGAGLTVARSMAVFPSWFSPNVAVTGGAQLPGTLTHVLGLLSMGDEKSAGMADISRVAEAARRAGTLPMFASGWFVVGRRDGDAAGSSPTASVEACVDLVHDGSSARFTAVEGGGSTVIQREMADHTQHLDVPQGARILLNLLHDHCANHDLAQIRSTLNDYVVWLRTLADGEGRLSAEGASASFGNVLWSASPVVLVPRIASATVDERAWASLDAFVESVVARGLTHPWPSATRPSTMISILAAMVGIDDRGRASAADATAKVGRAAHELPQIERLREANASLSSRAQWFEKRLNEREGQLRTIEATHRQDLRQEQAKAEGVRRSLTEVRSSVSYRAGRALLTPVQIARRALKKPTD